MNSSRGRSRSPRKRHSRHVSRSRSRDDSRHDSRSDNKSSSISQDKGLKLTEFFSYGAPLSGDRLWAANINDWVNHGLLNVEYNNDNLIKIDKIDSFDEGNKNTYKPLVKTNTIMIVQHDQIIGFGKFIAYETRLNRLHFDPYIKKENLNNYENYSRQPFFLEHAGEPSYNFYILKTSRNGGAIMRKSRKARKSIKARKSRKM